MRTRRLHRDRHLANVQELYLCQLRVRWTAMPTGHRLSRQRAILGTRMVRHGPLFGHESLGNSLLGHSLGKNSGHGGHQFRQTYL